MKREKKKINNNKSVTGPKHSSIHRYFLLCVTRLSRFLSWTCDQFGRFRCLYISGVKTRVSSHFHCFNNRIKSFAVRLNYSLDC